VRDDAGLSRFNARRGQNPAKTSSRLSPRTKTPRGFIIYVPKLVSRAVAKRFCN
jgi:hypothetical protein